jgi:hypothetical protein
MLETCFKDIPRVPAVEHLSYFLPMLGYPEVARGNNVAGNSNFSDQSEKGPPLVAWIFSKHNLFGYTVRDETLRVASPRLMGEHLTGNVSRKSKVRQTQEISGAQGRERRILGIETLKNISCYP